MAVSEAVPAKASPPRSAENESYAFYTLKQRISMTKNHNYNTPKQGSSDWHHPLNRNFEEIDTDVEIRDKEANRSDYAPKDGAKFIATDTRNVFLGDGSNWNQIGSLRNLPGDVYLQDSKPSNPSEGDLWIDTSSN